MPVCGWWSSGWECDQSAARIQVRGFRLGLISLQISWFSQFATAFCSLRETVCEQPADHFSRIGVTLTLVRDLPHSKQHGFNRDVINPQDGHILCDPYPAILGFSLRIVRSSRIVNSTISSAKEKLGCVHKRDPPARRFPIRPASSE
jgi:hypothetical protein